MMSRLHGPPKGNVNDPNSSQGGKDDGTRELEPWERRDPRQAFKSREVRLRSKRLVEDAKESEVDSSRDPGNTGTGGHNTPSRQIKKKTKP